MARVQVYECEVHGEFEYVEPLEEIPPKCPVCKKPMQYITTYEE
jgi:hypothetical protein